MEKEHSGGQAFKMKNVYIYCEGPTEESFVNELLYPYFFNLGIYVFPIVCTSKRTSEIKLRGGVSTFGKIRKELTMLCKSHPHEYVTTMFDYYAMPAETPEIRFQDADIFNRTDHVEEAIEKELALPNLKFHFMLHEFEGILFSRPESFLMIADERTVDAIRKIRDAFPTPEHINNSYETAPSRRLSQIIPGYAKIRHGTILSKDMGIDVIMEQCPHFRKWIREIAAL
ncbi:MAG: DUF4276 family protein [Lachnospiraceae bacterium]|nr:DUF4276 family protein [Lachnospiraceae bacterium]